MIGKQKSDEQSLRKQAESKLREKKQQHELSDAELAELVHELQVHQVELEIQNEELRRAHNDLQVSHQRFADLFHRAPVGYLVLDQNGFVQDVNETFCNMTDHLADQVKNNSVFDLISEKDRTWFMARYKAFYKKPEQKTMELELLTSGRETMPAGLNAISYTDSGKSDLEDAPLLLLTVSDISVRKRAEQALRDQTDLLATVFESSPNILMLVDANGRVEKINRAGSEFAGSPEEELIGLLGGEVFQCINAFDGLGCGRNSECPECPVRSRVMRSFESSEKILNDEGSLTVRRGAREIYIDFLISTVPVQVGADLKVLVTIVDISERKGFEEKLKRLLQEKEILLAEVHHRVKNNMQIIISLLGLQGREIRDEHIRIAFEESRNRIKSMALVHEQLYRAGKYAKIEFGEYVDQLVTTLVNMYDIDPEKIQIQIDAEGIYLDLEKAIPCGLLLNELITNSLKYAFPDGRRGKLWIHLEAHKENMILEVGDNGVGVPDGLDLEAGQSLGLQLVKLLATHDLQGSVKLMHKEGTQYIVEFPVQTGGEV
jgi:PAS domain S-box-containing protein